MQLAEAQTARDRLLRGVTVTIGKVGVEALLEDTKMAMGQIEATKIIAISRGIDSRTEEIGNKMAVTDIKMAGTNNKERWEVVPVQVTCFKPALTSVPAFLRAFSGLVCRAALNAALAENRAAQSNFSHKIKYF
uniref:Uncharacterized protein n=1 Tax=Pseudodiaptomus poplesia TaxID=213370 RepID=A0A1S6GLC0_9MAXI|nr:hypothetical protein [Pseudodiaptomus poplesia]